MGRRPPITRRTDTLFPYTTLCRSISRERSSVRERTDTNCDNKSVDAWPSGGHLIGMARLRSLLLMVPAASLAACAVGPRSEEHTSGLQSLMRFSYAVLCWNKKTNINSRTSVSKHERHSACKM